MAGGLLLLPAVSLKGGEVVIVRNRTYEPVEDEAGTPFAIDEFAEVFLKGFEAVLVFDIDGIEGEGAQYDEVSRLDASKLEVWWDAGARDHRDVVNMITSGVDRAVVSTRGISSLLEVEKAVELTENLVFEVVVRDGAVLAAARGLRGRAPGDAAGAAARAGAEAFLLLDASRPLGGPIDWARAAAVGAPAKSLYLGGGIELEAARSLVPPPEIPLRGLVVDLISVLAPFL